MTIRKTVFMFLGAAAIMAGLYGYKEYNRKNKDLANVKADIGLKTRELISAFEKDEKLANEKFLDKVIAVEGNVKEVTRDEKGYFTVVLGEEDNMSSVRCSMDSVHQRDASAIAEGTNITMKGICTGFNADELLGSDVILNRCVIEKN
jgi:hypothetical protein